MYLKTPDPRNRLTDPISSMRALGGKRHPGSRGTADSGSSFKANDFILWYYLGMKVAISVPDDLFVSAETVGKRLGLTRSRLYATALAEFIAKHRGRKVTDQLNRVYSTEDSRMESGLRQLQSESIRDDAW